MLIGATIERRLPWAGSNNARDLGGYATANGGFTKLGRIVRSDTLERLTADGRAALLAYGVRTIIDLRLPPELIEGPNSFAADPHESVTYLHRSLLNPDQDGEVGDAETLADHYRFNLTTSKNRITGILETIAEAPDGAVLFHCQAGKDRTGLIAAMLLDLAGVPQETIVADYALTNLCLEEWNRDYLENGPGDRDQREWEVAFFSAGANIMAETLDFLHQEFGGPSGYLRDAGLTSSSVDRLRNRMLAD